MNFLFLKNLDAHLHEIIHGTSIAFLFRCLGAVLAMAFQVAMARILGPEDMGRYVLSVSCVLFISVIGRIGLDAILVRHIAGHAAVGEWNSIVSIRSNAFKIVVPLTIVLAATLFLSSSWIANFIFKDDIIQSSLRVMAFAAPLWAIAALQSEMLRGLKKVGQYLFIQSISMAAITLFGVIVFGSKFGLIGQSAFYVVAAFFSMFIALGLWQRTETGIKTGGRDIPASELLKSSMPMLWVACVLYVNTWIATMILGAHGDPAEVAIFNAASRLALAPSFLLISVNSILGPKFSAIYKTGSREELQRVAAHTTQLLFWLVLPLMAAFFVFPESILGIFGSEFKSASLVLRILVAGQIASFMTGFAGQLLLMTGHEKDIRNVTTVSVIFNIVMSFLLIALYKTTGAAWAAALTTGLTSIALVFFVKKRLNISAHIFTTFKR